MALTGVVRKGGLLRGKVPQGETSPLKPGVKVCGLSLCFKKNLGMALGMAFFLAKRLWRPASKMIWHAVEGRAKALPRRIYINRFPWLRLMPPTRSRQKMCEETWH